MTTDPCGMTTDPCGITTDPCGITTGPFVFTAEMYRSLARPAFSKAPTMASPAREDSSVVAHKAKTEGPEPEMEQPSAPADRAAAFTAANPGMSMERAGSATTS